MNNRSAFLHHHRVSVTLAVMNLPLLGRIRHIRWTRRRILAGLGLCFLTIGLLCLFLMRDPDRAIAIEIYDALKPGMTELEVREMFACKRQHVTEVFAGVPALRCDIGPRFVVVVAFESGTVSAKAVRERSTKMTTSSRIFHELLKRVGLPIEPLNRTWTKS